MHTQLAYHTAIARLDERHRAARRHRQGASPASRHSYLPHLRRCERPGRARRIVTRLRAAY